MPTVSQIAIPRRSALAAFFVAVTGCDIRDEIPRKPRPQALLGDGIAAAGRGTPTIEYVGGYEAARQRSSAEGRALLLVCTAGWCRFSTDLVQRTLRHPDLVALSRRFVCVLLDADRDADVCRDLHVRAFPTLVVLDDAGAERLRVTGRSSPETLVTALERALEQPRLATAGGEEAVVR